jgi:multiple sugar transport system substrate-binding protein
VVDDSDAYQSVLDAYRKLHPNVTLNYRRLRLEQYENELVNALAEDRGPDIFLIHNDWVGKYLPKIEPMPKETKVAYRIVTGTVKKELSWELRTEPTLSLKQYKDAYADAVLGDGIRPVNVGTDKPTYENRVVGVPVSLDTLALYYNKDLLNLAGIATPPEDWGQVQAMVPKLRKVTGQGELQQAAIAMGTAYNVERASDIVQALMMQNGAVMYDDQRGVSFHVMPANLQDSRTEPPGYQALQFYTDFANKEKETYTWNASLPNSLDLFEQGRAAFFLGYSYHLPQIRAAAPKLNLGITKLPQVGEPAKNLANYWLWTVSKKSKSTTYAWNFLNYLAQPENSKLVLGVTKRPAALRSLLNDQLQDEDIGVFASQVLTAQSWYRGKDPVAMENAFLEMVDNVVNGTAPPDQLCAVSTCEANTTMSSSCNWSFSSERSAAGRFVTPRTSLEFSGCAR